MNCYFLKSVLTDLIKLPTYKRVLPLDSTSVIAHHKLSTQDNENSDTKSCIECKYNLFSMSWTRSKKQYAISCFRPSVRKSRKQKYK